MKPADAPAPRCNDGKDSKALRRLHRAGVQIGAMDAMIVGHALAAGTVLVTNNERHFSRVPALAIENWSKEHD